MIMWTFDGIISAIVLIVSITLLIILGIIMIVLFVYGWFKEKLKRLKNKERGKNK